MWAEKQWHFSPSHREAQEGLSHPAQEAVQEEKGEPWLLTLCYALQRQKPDHTGQEGLGSGTD